MSKRAKDANEILNKLTEDDVELRQMIMQETINAEVARLIYDAREAAGMTQIELAKLVGTSQSTIARLEDADYQGHSLNMLIRIAAALGKEVHVSLGSVVRDREAA